MRCYRTMRVATAYLFPRRSTYTGWHYDWMSIPQESTLKQRVGRLASRPLLATSRRFLRAKIIAFLKSRRTTMINCFKIKHVFTLVAFTITGMLTISLAAPPAFAATTVTIQHPFWAGYAASGSPFPTPSQPTKVLYSNVKGSWKIPEASCSAGEHSKATFWVGLGGTMGELEQIGTLIQCDDGVLQYDPVYEMIHAGRGEVVFIKDKHPKYVVNPNDQISAEVQYLDKGHYKLSITNGHWSFVSPVLSGGATASAHDAALWITEAPSVNDQVASLTFFGTVSFSKCKAGGKPISTGPAITEIFMSVGNHNKATPSPLDSTGTAFTVSIPQS
jgi:Peptidase A4 family